VGFESCRFFNKDEMQETVRRVAALSVLLSRKQTLHFSTDLCGSRLFQTFFFFFQQRIMNVKQTKK
jgi:hypothetical protein